MSETQATAAPNRRNRRKEEVGIVVSNRMTRSVVVEVERLVPHPRYRRVLKRRARFMAHDEKGCQIGDKVRIVESRPMSASKRWRILEVVKGIKPVSEIKEDIL
ncbi:MAG: 30S ribosomal protein S17 [Acidobacteria bacterium]|nr:30S ribosomal protein S17 [Acidobacteriota bacterium]